MGTSLCAADICKHHSSWLWGISTPKWCIFLIPTARKVLCCSGPAPYGARMLPMVRAEPLLLRHGFTRKTQRQMPGLDKPFPTDKMNRPTGVLLEIGAELTHVHSPGYLSYQQ